MPAEQVVQTDAGRHPRDPQAARAEHDRRVAAARRKIETSNTKAAIKRAKVIDKALQKAAARFLPSGTSLGSPAVLNLVRWPYTPGQRIQGTVPSEVKDRILREDVICRWCNTEPATTIDHVRPLNRGGTNHVLNLVGACGPCNSAKADFMPLELGWKLRLPLRAFAHTPEMPRI